MLEQKIVRYICKLETRINTWLKYNNSSPLKYNVIFYMQCNKLLLNLSGSNNLQPVVLTLGSPLAIKINFTSV